MCDWMGGMRAGECMRVDDPHTSNRRTMYPPHTFQAEAIIEALDRQASMRWVQGF